MGTLTPGNGLQQPAGGRHAAALTPNRLIPSPAVRRWLYGSAIAVLGVLGVFGLVTAEQTVAIGNAIGVLLAIAPISLALANTPSGN